VVRLPKPLPNKSRLGATLPDSHDLFRLCDWYDVRPYRKLALGDRCSIDQSYKLAHRNRLNCFGVLQLPPFSAPCIKYEVPILGPSEMEEAKAPNPDANVV
jgi:hypothetical protein